MKDNFITFKQYKNSICSQPFFIWNSLDQKVDNYDYEMDGEISKHYWSNVSNDVENTSFSEITTRTFFVIDKWLINFLSKKYDSIIIDGNKEERILKTKNALSSGKLLINPLFEYKGALSSPIGFDTKTKTVIEHKYSKKTKLIDGIKCYWDYEVITRGSTPIKDFVLFLPVNKNNYKKGEIDLVPIKEIHTTKTGKLPGEENSSKKSTEVMIMDFVKNPSNKTFKLPNFEKQIEYIENARTSKFNKKLVHMDLEQFDINPNKDEILEKIGFKYWGWNGNVVRKKAIIEYLISHSEELFKNEVMKKMEGLTKSEVLNKLIEIETIDNSKKVIWYDFEGYSLPFSPVDYISPYSQVVFQVSVIETNENIETCKENLVIDPLTLSLDDFPLIIKSVYSNGADAYVVYNKGYENARIKEMVEVLEHDNHPLASESRKMYEEIVEKTVDLYDLFRISSGNKLPSVIMHDQKAKASIKNVEKHITNNKIPIPRPIEQYSALEVQNGGMAMDIAVKRALNLIGDLEWKNKVYSLKKYCENDVRAMIIVYDFVKILMRDKNETT